MKPISRNVLSAVFSGLTNQEIHSVISIAKAWALKAGDTLIDIQDREKAVYIVLKGSIEIIREFEGFDSEVETLGVGSWIGEIGFSAPIARTTRAVAGEETAVIAIKDSAFPTLSPSIQVYMLKKMNDLAAKRIQELINEEKELKRKADTLRKRKIQTHQKNREDYDGSDLIQGIINKVPKLPVFTVGLTEKLVEDKITLEEVSTIVKGDPALVGMVLKSINSAYYNLQHKITSIHQAILFLGFSRLHQLLLSEGLKQIMPKTPEFRELHSKSVAVSNIAYALALSAKTCDPVQASTIGLLKEVGQIVIHLLNQQNPKLKMLIQGIDAPIIGATLLKQWNLPDIIWKSVDIQDWPEFMPPECLPGDAGNHAAILYLSEICYQNIRKKTPPEPQPAYLTEYCKMMGWESDSITDIVRKKLLPGLFKNIKAFPEFFRIILKNYL